MPYQFAIERPDYSDLASGKVFYSFAGHPAFPVRLASEILQRCLALRRRAGLNAPAVLYDPCCGTAYLLAVLAYLHPENLRKVIASDFDEQAVGLAQRNLELLTPSGMERRLNEIQAMIGLYGKASHQEALHSAQILQARVAALPAFALQTFQANALDGAALAQNLPGQPVDMVVTDVPYGQHSQWQGQSPDANPLQSLLSALSGVLAPGGVVAIASDKQQKVPRDGYRRVDHFQVGKRKIEILQPQ
jgi:23S rRNA G2445 N2-methylase RlmL